MLRVAAGLALVGFGVLYLITQERGLSGVGDVGVALLVWVLRRQRDVRVAAVLLSGALYGAAFMGPLIWWMNAVSSGAYVALVAAQVVMLAVIAGLCVGLAMLKLRMDDV